MIGYMQGRLSPVLNGRIQCFPKDIWHLEFPIARELGLKAMEWTLDHEDLVENPLMSVEGRNVIRNLCRQHAIQIPSVTGDNFMQAPFFKAERKEKAHLIEELRNVIQACGDLGIGIIVFPLVDNSALENVREELELRNVLLSQIPLLQQAQVRIAFESDYSPANLLRFIQTFPKDYFGINYDTGNSAGMGFDPEEEISTYGSFIFNVHIKDRVLGGTTVPLGTGAADFDIVFAELKALPYRGNYILQTARAQDGEHPAVLRNYFRFVRGYLGDHHGFES